MSQGGTNLERLEASLLADEVQLLENRIAHVSVGAESLEVISVAGSDARLLDVRLEVELVREDNLRARSQS